MRYPDAMRIVPPPPPTSFPPLPAASPWLLLRTVFKGRSRSAAPPPATHYRLDRIDAAHVARYRAAFGFRAEGVPLTYLYLLAQRAQLASMLVWSLPFRIPGLIHVENTLALHGPLRPGAALVLTTSLSLPPPAANGAVHAVLRTEARDGATAIFDCESVYLIKRGRRNGPGAGPRPAPPSGTARAQWALATDAGRRYAALSGDFNPIHLWPWSARLMGMRRPIIHGMHTVASACAAFEQSQPTQGSITMLQCRFTQPVPLGATAFLHDGAAPGGFVVVCNDRVALEGTLARA